MDLTSLSHWSDNNHLSFNISKFVFMQFHNKFNSEYTIDGNVITHSSSCKDLGINFSDDLSWRSHYQIIMLLLKPTNHLACYGVYSLIFTVLRQEKLYIFQLPDLPYYTVHVCGNPIYCLTSN